MGDVVEQFRNGHRNTTGKQVNPLSKLKAAAAVAIFLSTTGVLAAFGSHYLRISKPAKLASFVAPGNTKAKDSPPRNDEALIIRAKENLLADFFDPGSAQFRNVSVRVRKSDKKAVVCGEINGKNRYGGYVGYRPFYFDGDESNILFMDDHKYDSNPAYRELAIMSFKFLGCTDDRGKLSYN